MTVYTNTARFDHARALTEDEMFQLAPSIFATKAHESRSERFQPIPTIKVLHGLTKEGFMAVGVKQSVARDAGNAKVIEGTYSVLGEARNALAAPADWSTISLNSDERSAFAESAHVIRFGDTEGRPRRRSSPRSC